jgi:hypothetical protein
LKTRKRYAEGREGRMEVKLKLNEVLRKVYRACTVDGENAG